MKKALIVVTSHSELGNTGKKTGWYLPEVTHIYYPLVDAGFQVEFASPKGGAAPMDPGSFNLNDTYNRRFVEEDKLLGRLEVTTSLSEVNPENYHVIAFAGGHGTMWDFADSLDLQNVAAKIYENGGIVAAVCHGPAALVNIKLSNGSYLVDGKDVAGFTNAEEEAAGLTNIVPFLLESTLVARGATFKGAPNWQKNVVVSHRVITGQNPQSALALGEAIANLWTKA